MLHLLKDLQEEIITSEIEINKNTYRFEVEGCGFMVVAVEGDSAHLHTEDDSKTYTDSPINLFNLIPSLHAAKNG